MSLERGTAHLSRSRVRTSWMPLFDGAEVVHVSPGVI